eukprot:3936739-Rhodomonas_salina.3
MGRVSSEHLAVAPRAWRQHTAGSAEIPAPRLGETGALGKSTEVPSVLMQHMTPAHWAPTRLRRTRYPGTQLYPSGLAIGGAPLFSACPQRTSHAPLGLFLAFICPK